MPKYQVILYSDIQLPDDEFLRYVKIATHKVPFKVVSAQNLEGIREEVWHCSGCGHEEVPVVNGTFCDGVVAEPPDYVKSWVEINLGTTVDDFKPVRIPGFPFAEVTADDFKDLL